jgi:hypothetical protein
VTDPQIDLSKPHSEYGRCPLGDECPCWQEGWKDSLEHRTVRPSYTPLAENKLWPMGGDDFAAWVMVGMAVVALILCVLFSAALAYSVISDLT